MAIQSHTVAAERDALDEAVSAQRSKIVALPVAPQTTLGVEDLPVLVQLRVLHQEVARLSTRVRELENRVR